MPQRKHTWIPEVEYALNSQHTKQSIIIIFVMASLIFLWLVQHCGILASLHHHFSFHSVTNHMHILVR